MTAIEKLKKYVLAAFPDAKAELTAPLRKTGFWSLDLDYAGVSLSIHWREGSGFDLSSVRPDSYGEGADEHLESYNDAVARIEQIFSGKESVSPPLNVLLSRVREQRGMTQLELATMLGVKQASISGIERRQDIQLSTLKRFVEALGGSLEVFLKFPDGLFRLGSFAIRGIVTAEIPAEPKHRPPRFHRRAPTFDRLLHTGQLPAAQSKADYIRQKQSVFEMY